MLAIYNRHQIIEYWVCKIGMFDYLLILLVFSFPETIYWKALYSIKHHNNKKQYTQK